MNYIYETYQDKLFYKSKHSVILKLSIFRQ